MEMISSFFLLVIVVLQLNRLENRTELFPWLSVYFFGIINKSSNLGQKSERITSSGRQRGMKFHENYLIGIDFKLFLFTLF